MERVEEFLRTYNNLDREVRRALRVDNRMSHMKSLEIMAKKNDTIAANLGLLKQYARLRNCLVHDTIQGMEAPIAIPMPEVVERYKEIFNKFKNPLTVLDICTHRSNMLLASPESSVIDLMEAMKELLISRVPVVRKGRVIGMFSGNTLIYYLMSLPNCELSKRVRMDELGEFTDLDKQRKEKFEFVSKSINIYDAERFFKKSNKKSNKLIGLIITTDGTAEGKLLGMVTEWDLFNCKK